MIGMTGLQKICKMYGKVRMGDTVWLWDYVNDKPRPEKEKKNGATEAHGRKEHDVPYDAADLQQDRQREGLPCVPRR